MRASGEAKHQAATPSEAAVYVVASAMIARGGFEQFFGKTDRAIGEAMDSLEERMRIAISRFDR